MSDAQSPAVAASPASSALQNFSLGELLGSPGMRQILALFGVALAVAAGVTIFMWSQKPAMQALYSGLSDRDGAEIVEALRAAAIPFEQDSASGAILVEAGKVHEARMQLAGQGLPRGSGGGIELINQEQGIGVSQFMETARYQHALETELGRTISQMQPVRSARVHLAIPKRSAFARKGQEASASVLISLYPGRRLENGQVDAIVHLVASSIPDLLASKVSVVDEAGRLLSRSGEDSMSLNASQLDYRNELEASYRQRIERLLTPIMGMSGLSAQVSVELDYSQMEETRESYAPDRTALRSEQLSENRDPEMRAAGVPGALTNRVPGEADAETGDAAGVRSLQRTRNYEVDRTVSMTRSQPGRIQRISTAVLVDNKASTDAEGKAVSAPLSAEEMAQIEALVREAVGFDAERGDSLSVRNISFAGPETIEPVEVAVWERPMVMDIVRQVLGALVLLVIAFMILRPALKSALKPALQVASPAPAGRIGGQVHAVVDDEDFDEEADFAPKKKPMPKLERKLGVAREAAKEDPKRVAQLMKQWVGDE